MVLNQRVGTVGSNMLCQETWAEGWHSDKHTRPRGDACLSAGAKHWISQLMFTMLQEMREQDCAVVAGCVRGGAEWVLLQGHGRAIRGRGQLWHSLGETLTQWEERLGSSRRSSPSLTMRVALLAFRLMCLAWFWPVTQLSGSHFANKRRHKEMYVGENTKQKHGGWATARFLMWCVIVALLLLKFMGVFWHLAALICVFSVCYFTILLLIWLERGEQVIGLCQL